MYQHSVALFQISAGRALLVKSKHHMFDMWQGLSRVF